MFSFDRFFFSVSVLASFAFCFVFQFCSFLRFCLSPVLITFSLVAVFLRSDKFRTLSPLFCFVPNPFYLSWVSTFETESILIRTSSSYESFASNFIEVFLSVKSKSLIVEPPSFSVDELRSRTATASTPLNPKRQSLGALRSDRRFPPICRYKYRSNPSEPFPPLHCLLASPFFHLATRL